MSAQRSGLSSTSKIVSLVLLGIVVVSVYGFIDSWHSLEAIDRQEEKYMIDHNLPSDQFSAYKDHVKISNFTQYLEMQEIEDRQTSVLQIAIPSIVGMMSGSVCLIFSTKLIQV